MTRSGSAQPPTSAPTSGPPRAGPGAAVPAGPVRDGQRSAVYDAEHLVHRVFDRSWQFPTVEVAGSRLTLPPERHFSSVGDVRRYLERLRSWAPLTDAYARAAVPIMVRERRGQASAHYERSGAVIALPPPTAGRAWALRELVVLHEVAHHLATDRQAAELAQHGAAFTGRLVQLVGLAVGPEAELLYRVTFDDCAVKVG